MAKKRVMIFSPEAGTQEKIGNRVLENYAEIFKKYPETVEIQKFADIGEALEMGNDIGLGGEILVVFDSYLQIRDKRRPPYKLILEEKLYVKCLEQRLIAAQHVCRDKGLPFIVYQGEIHKGHEIAFKQKLKEIEPLVLSRLMYGESAEIYPEDSEFSVLESIKNSPTNIS